MLIFKPDKNIYGNTIEVHYWFDDKSHTMDALIENRCEYEILGLIAEVGKLLDYDITIETEAIGEGGLRKWLQVVGKQENKEGTITTAVITAIVILILITPLSEITESLVEKWFEDKELTELQKEKLRLEIRKLNREEEKEFAQLDSNFVIKKKRSNFYEKLEKVDKLEKVSFKTWDEKKENDSEEKEVPKHKFYAYILSSDEIGSLEDENAVIEIISPVLKKGNYKWSGYYKGEIIKFSMKSEEFKDLVQAGKIPFINGSSIDCNLIFKQKIDSDGILLNSGYEVTRVNKYFESDKPIETREGRSYRVNKEAKEKHKQLDLFAQQENENR